MPDRFAAAVWVNPAAMRQCRTFFAKCDTPLLLLVLEVWRGFSAISQSAYPTSLTVAMTKGALSKRRRGHRAHYAMWLVQGGPRQRSRQSRDQSPSCQPSSTRQDQAGY